MEIDEVLFPDKSRLIARAHYLGDRIDFRSGELGPVAMGAAEFRQVGEGYAFIFRYGALVTIEVAPELTRGLLKDMGSFVKGAATEPHSEEAVILVTPDVDEGGRRRSSVELGGVAGDIVIKSATFGRLQIVAEVLGKSIALSYFEERVAEIFDRIEPLAESLKQGVPRSYDKKLFHLLGDATSTLVHTTGRVEIRDKPDIAWDRHDLDKLYEQVRIEYELRDRDVAITRKLELISTTTNSFFHIGQARRTHRVEWYITILIVIEIVLGLLGVFG